MWANEHSAEIAASRESLWDRLIDVDHWEDWHPNVKTAHIEGAGGFEMGARIKMEQKGAPTTTVSVVALEPGRSYATEDRLPLCKLRFEHWLEDAGDGRIRVTIRQSGAGPLAGLFHRIFGGKMRTILPEQLRLLDGIASAPPPASPAAP
jgi:hypothetical protein